LVAGLYLGYAMIGVFANAGFNMSFQFPWIGIIVAAAIGLIARKDWRAIAASSRREVAIAAVTTVGVITVGVLQALLIAVALSILDTVSRAAKPHDAVLGWVDRLGRYADVSMHPSAQQTPGVVVYRLDDRWFYANSHYIQARIMEALDSAEASPSWLVFDAEGMPDVDATGVASVEQLVDQLRAQHVKVVVARLKSPVAQTFESTGLIRIIGPENFQPTVERAVAVCLERSVPAQGDVP
jgi:MFS superfamily sulfate permease-like transporter